MKRLIASRQLHSNLSVIISLVLIALFSPVSVSAQYYYVSGTVNPSGNGIGGEHRIHTEQVTAYSDYAEVSGPNGQLAISKYKADLATGQIGAYSYARSDFENYAQSGSANTNIEMYDTLNFHVPAGTYPDGVLVTLNGSINGTFSSSGQAQERGHFQAFWGNETYDLADYQDWGNYDAAIHHNFQLTTTIVQPSPNPRPELTTSVHVRLTLSAGRPLSASAPRTTDYGEAVADFYEGIQIYSLHVPAGVTWDSESGVFLSSFALVGPDDGAVLSSAPTFQWTSGPFDIFAFFSVFYYPGYGYYLYPPKGKPFLWLIDTSLPMPVSWWNKLASGQTHYWAVLGYSVSAQAWMVAGPWSFTKD